MGGWGEHSIMNEHRKELHLIPLINLVFMICTVSYSQVFSAQIYDPRVKWENIQLWMNISRTCSNKYLLLTLFLWFSLKVTAKFLSAQIYDLRLKCPCHKLKWCNNLHNCIANSAIWCKPSDLIGYLSRQDGPILPAWVSYFNPT